MSLDVLSLIKLLIKIEKSLKLDIFIIKAKPKVNIEVKPKVILVEHNKADLASKV